jgi:predicted kinase
MSMERVVYLLRGLPGAGRSRCAAALGCAAFEADAFFVRDGVYQFDAAQIAAAHQWCINSVHAAMDLGVPRIAVANTFSQAWELEPYQALASEHGYTVFALIVENRHDGASVHAVPDEVIEAMRQWFEIRL